MRPSAVTLLVVLTKSLAFGQVPAADSLDAPPMPPVIANPRLDDAPQADPAPPSPPPPARTWAQRCLARPAAYYGGPGLYWYQPMFVGGQPIGPISASHGAKPVDGEAAPTSSSSSGSSSGGKGGGLGEMAAIIVVAAVVVAAVLPFIIYAFDEDATDDVLGRFECPQVDLDVRSGITADAFPGFSTPLFLRARASDGWFGLQAQFDLAPWNPERSTLDGSVSAWFRMTPRQHVEIGFTAGYRSQVLRGTFRPGFEVAMPHEYVFSRTGAAQFGLEVRPSVFIYRGAADVSLDLALRIPLGPYASVVLGGRLFTLEAVTAAGAAAQLGLAVKL